MKTILTLLEAGDPRDPALVVGESGAVLTFGELTAEVESLARRLRARGIGRGDRVTIVIPKGPDFVRLLLAVNAIGATAAPLNPAYTRDEYSFYLDDLQPKVLVLPEGEMPAAREAASESTEVLELAEGALLGKDGEVDFEAARPDDVALLLHTSGTTSRPKQVPLTHANVLASARTIVDSYELSSSDVSYCAMPLFHVHGLIASVFSAWLGGGRVVIPSRVTPRAFWSQSATLGVTWFSATPTLHEMILGRRDSAEVPQSLRFARSCSSALSPALMARLEGTLSVPVLEAYGMTEASHQMASNPLPPAPRVPGSVGVPTGVEIRIFDPTGRECSERESGEVVVRGASVMSGYLGNPDANRAAFFGDWFRTGDRGRFDDGYLRLEGRLKEMILRGGENISPYEIEDVLKAHPGVIDAVCFGIDDEKYGEKVGAAIVLSTDADEPDIAAWCRHRLAAFKVPEAIRFVDEIPRTATGKVQRKRVGQALFGAGE